ncbi:MAG: ABC transporter ATP-binding protein [Bacillota bacterium]
MATLTFKDIKKVYTEGADPAVDEFNLEIKDKEFVVFVGPSGCGKSTTLRMVAGLEDITAGELYIDDHLVNDVAPKNRDIAMVFQSYALYPHMTVYNNMAFGLKLRKEPRDQIDEKVQRAANILGLTEYLDRKPKALSGGQRQRVALGRAIVRNAKVFLMDEPLSNLDAKLRVQMRGEIIKLHKKIETTTIYVTHDQIEAMTMADRIVVMKDGFIQQVGAPKEIYDNPNNIFVGGFIGTPPMNFFKGNITEEGMFSCEGMSVQTPKKQMDLLKKRGYLGKEVIMGIRPEDIHDNDAMRKKHAESVVKFKVDVAELLGSETSVFAKVGDNDVTAMIDARADIEIGDELEMALDMSKSHFFDIETTNRIK